MKSLLQIQEFTPIQVTVLRKSLKQLENKEIDVNGVFLQVSLFFEEKLYPFKDYNGARVDLINAIDQAEKKYKCSCCGQRIKRRKIIAGKDYGLKCAKNQQKQYNQLSLGV